jgi:lipopolysaccharide export system protein LptC
MNLTELAASTHAGTPSGRLSGGLDAETEMAERHRRLARQAVMVRRRSRRVKLMRVLLPAGIGGLLLLNVGWIAVQSIINSLNTYSSSDVEVRMTNPHYFGRNDQGEHYTVSGLEAVRRMRDSTKITLKAPQLDFRSQSGELTHVTAANGVYDQNTRQLTLMGNVVMSSTGSNLSMKTEEAVVDMINSTISGDKHVEGTTASGHIEAESFVISQNGRHSVFHGKGDKKVWITVNNAH